MSGLPGYELDGRGLPKSWSFKPELEVTPRQVQDLLARKAEMLLVDCRRDEEWAFNRIETGVHVAMSTIEQNLDVLEDGPEGKERQIVVYCHHGVRSLKVATTLKAHGFINARSMAGGIDLWSVDIDPKVPRY